MTLEAEINLYCPGCKRDFCRLLDPAEYLKCEICGGVLQCKGFQVVEM